MSAANALRSIGLALDCSEDASPSVIAREALRVIAERDELRARLADARPTVVRVALSDAPVPSLCAVETWLRSHGGLLIPGSTAVVTMRAPEPDVSTTHTHGGRPS